MMALMDAALDFRHVDVFADVPFAGNGLIVLFGETSGVRTEALISLTVEMRQFELIVVDLQPQAECWRGSSPRKRSCRSRVIPSLVRRRRFTSATPSTRRHARGCL